VAKGLAQRVRRIGLRDPCRVEILGHQRLNGADAQRCAGLEGAWKDVRGFERLGVAPLMQRFVGFKGAVDHPIDLACAGVEANRPRLEMATGPREGPDLTDPTLQRCCQSLRS
jgi:hypothetical protein